jgi:hypothetical protein
MRIPSPSYGRILLSSFPACALSGDLWTPQFFVRGSPISLWGCPKASLLWGEAHQVEQCYHSYKLVVLSKSLGFLYLGGNCCPGRGLWA